MIQKLIYIEHLKGKDASIDKLFDYVDDCFIQGNFKEVDDFISTIPINIISLQLIISILSITLAAKTKLRNRNKFVKDAEEVILKTESKERCKRLLDGLR